MWLRALSVPFLVAAALGAAISVAATGIITPSLWLSATLCWAIVPVLQALIGLLVLRTPRLSLPAFLESLFSTHRPWTLWYLAVAGAFLVWPRMPPWVVDLSVLAPLVLTIRLLLRVSVEQWGYDGAAAARRVAAHQVVTAAVIVSTQVLSIVPRVLGWFA